MKKAANMEITVQNKQTAMEDRGYKGKRKMSKRKLTITIFGK